jgi:hypothetical protein
MQNTTPIGAAAATTMSASFMRQINSTAPATPIRM